MFRRSRNGLRPAARSLQGAKKSRFGGQGQQHRLQDAQNGAAAAAVRVPGGVILHTVQGHHLAGGRQGQQHIGYGLGVGAIRNGQTGGGDKRRIQTVHIPADMAEGSGDIAQQAVQHRGEALLLDLAHAVKVNALFRNDPLFGGVDIPGEDDVDIFRAQGGQPPADGGKLLPAKAQQRRDGHAVDIAGKGGIFGVDIGVGTTQHYSPEELSLVWVDAHTDINTENSSLSGNIHGMPIAALLGLCGQELSSVCGGLPALRPENVHIIFARDIDPAEERIIAEQGVHLYRMSEIKEQGLSAVLHRLLGNITTPFCHVSWDVDSLDASFIPATGLPIPDGPDPKAVTDVLLALAASGKMVALDCVEYNPARDSDGSCCRTVLGILEPVLLALAAKP